jgi:hypothetical protein
MSTQNSRASAVDTLEEGGLLRWSKQMCLRGRARCFDEDGLCGKQKLVCTGDRQRLLANVNTLYPGAKVTLAKAATGCKQSRAEALLSLFSNPDLPDEVSTNWVGQQLERSWHEATPRTLVVIGRSTSLSEDNRRQLAVMQGRMPWLSILTYDDVIDRARAELERLLGPLSLRARNLTSSDRRPFKAAGPIFASLDGSGGDIDVPSLHRLHSAFLRPVRTDAVDRPATDLPRTCFV